MTILITGGTGFVGLAIVEELLSSGRSVVTYGPQAVPAAARAYFERQGGRLACEIGDVCDGPGLRRALQRHNVTKIVHGAAITAGADRERTQPHPVIQVNLVGTLEVLEAALCQGVQQVVQLGTGSVYGASVKHEGALDPASDAPIPDSLYGITKYAAERLACRYRNTRGLNIAVARLGVVFGRWEHDTGVRDTLSLAYNLVRLARQGEHARLAPALPNDWVYSRDVGRAVALMLQAGTLQHDVYQIATGHEWSATHWCELLARRFPGFSHEVAGSVQDANIGRVTPTARPPFSIERLRMELGYAPAYDAEAALDDYLTWLDADLLSEARPAIDNNQENRHEA
jgi:nucleoside-diphosphate-sugar epimerase